MLTYLFSRIAESQIWRMGIVKQRQATTPYGVITIYVVKQIFANKHNAGFGAGAFILLREGLSPQLSDRWLAEAILEEYFHCVQVKRTPGMAFAWLAACAINWAKGQPYDYQNANEVEAKAMAKEYADKGWNPFDFDVLAWYKEG